MSENVVISKRKADGEVRVFRNLTEAAERLGISRQAISKAMLEGRQCKGMLWKKGFRIYVVKVDGEYQVCRKGKIVYKQVAGGKAWGFRTVDPTKVVEITAQIWGETM